MNAVVTLTTIHFAGHAYSHPSFLSYANRIGADFIVIRERKMQPWVIMFEKFRVGELFDMGYDRVLYIDSDTFIKPDCEDLFEEVPEDCIGAVYDCTENIPANEDRIPRVLDRLGHIEWKSGYLNAGVYVASKIHRELYKIPGNAINEAWWEQDVFNYNIVKNGFKIHKLHHKYNAMRLYGYHTHKICDMTNAKIAHFAAQGDVIKKLQHMYERYKDDIERYNAGSSKKAIVI